MADAEPRFLPSPETSRAAARLARQVEWSNGFWLAYVFTSSPPQVHLLQRGLERHLAKHGKVQRIIRPRTSEELEHGLEAILNGETAGCTWLEAIRGRSLLKDAWSTAWLQFILRTNERRELLRSTLEGGLILALHPDMKPDVRQAGPDLWSIRTFVFELPIGPSLPTAGLEDVRSASVESHSDPELLAADLARLPDLLPGQDPEDQARTLVRSAERLRNVGRLEEAAQYMECAIGLYSSLAESQVGFEPQLAESLAAYGNLLTTSGLGEEALAAAHKAVALRRTLTATQAEVFEPALVKSLNDLGMCLAALTRWDEAERVMREACQIGRRLASQDPANFGPLLATSLDHLGVTSRSLGALEEAFAATREAVELRRKFVTIDRDLHEPLLATALTNHALDLEALGRREEALELTREAVAMLRRLAAERAVFEPELAVSLNNLGGMLSGRAEALAVTREAVEIRRRLAKKAPTLFEAGLANSLNNYGIDLQAHQRMKEAVEVTREAVAIRRKLVKGRPGLFETDLASSLNNLAGMLNVAGRNAKALKVAREGLDLLQRAESSRPDVYAPNLAQSLGNLALIHRSRGDFVASRSTFIEALGLLRPHYRRFPLTFEALARNLLQGLENTCSAGNLEFPAELRDYL
ncbi:tetratricopeptide repeat protein [Nannocystaceae bacterium ST9]